MRRRQLYIPAVSILMAVITLLVLTAVSTLRNLERDRERNLAALERQGVTLLRALEAGVRAGLALPQWRGDAIGTLLEETGREEPVAYIYLCDREGRILHHSLRTIEGTASAWVPEVNPGNPVARRIRTLPDGSRVLDVAKTFMPMAPLSMPERIRWEAFHSRHGEIIVLGMRMDAYEAARKDDIHHALVMGAILIVLGGASLFFLLVIQNVQVLNRALRRSRDLNREIISNMADGLAGIDAEGRIVVANRIACDLLRMEDPAAAETRIDGHIDLDATGVRATLEKGTPVINREILVPGPNGGEIPISISATPIRNDTGSPGGVVLLLRDLRQIKRLQDEVRRSERLAAIGRLAASVAHEIRNPLSSIRGFAGYLSAILEEQPKEKGYAEIMVAEVDRINRVITDLLSLSRSQSTEIAEGPVRPLLNHVAALARGDSRAKGVSVRVTVADDVQTIAADRNQMTQALLNLVINALNAVEGDSGEIEMGGSPHAGGDGVDLWVEDNGCGIDPTHVNRIFEPFFTTREEGTGLGLAIVQNIVDNHGGSVSVQSPPPVRPTGTRITLHLPQPPKGGDHGAQDPHRR
ncbi:MAG: two-component system sensor histidine kinase NtrB [Desulfobacterales bacterium]